MCAVAVHNSIRFGVEGRELELTLELALAAAAAVSLAAWWHPAIAAVCAVPILGMLWRCLRTAEGWRTAACLLLVLAVQWVLFHLRFPVFCVFGLGHPIVDRLFWHIAGVQILWPWLIWDLVSMWAVVTACSFAYRWTQPRVGLTPGNGASKQQILCP